MAVVNLVILLAFKFGVGIGHILGVIKWIDKLYHSFFYLFNI